MYQKLHRETLVSQFSDFPSKAASGWCWCILWNIRKIVTYFFCWCLLLLLQLLIYSNNFLNGDFNAILFHVCALFSVLGMLQLPKWNWPFSSVCKLEIVYGGLILKFRGINMAKATFVCPIDAIFWYNREESLDKIEPESCLKRLAGSSSRKETNGGDGKARDYCTLK